MRILCVKYFSETVADHSVLNARAHHSRPLAHQKKPLYTAQLSRHNESAAQATPRVGPLCLQGAALASCASANHVSAHLNMLRTRWLASAPKCAQPSLPHSGRLTVPPSFSHHPPNLALLQVTEQCGALAETKGMLCTILYSAENTGFSQASESSGAVIAEGLLGCTALCLPGLFRS